MLFISLAFAAFTLHPLSGLTPQARPVVVRMDEAPAAVKPEKAPSTPESIAANKAKYEANKVTTAAHEHVRPEIWRSALARLSIQYASRCHR